MKDVFVQTLDLSSNTKKWLINPINFVSYGNKTIYKALAGEAKFV